MPFDEKTYKHNYYIEHKEEADALFWMGEAEWKEMYGKEKVSNRTEN